MAFSDSPFRGAMLVLLDGSDLKLAPRVECSSCGRPLLRVFTTAGTRVAAPSLERHRDVCITKRWKLGMPCPRALASVTVLDALLDASRV